MARPTISLVAYKVEPGYAEVISLLDPCRLRIQLGRCARELNSTERAFHAVKGILSVMLLLQACLRKKLSGRKIFFED